VFYLCYITASNQGPLLCLLQFLATCARLSCILSFRVHVKLFYRIVSYRIELSSFAACVYVCYMFIKYDLIWYDTVVGEPLHTNFYLPSTELNECDDRMDVGYATTLTQATFKCLLVTVCSDFFLTRVLIPIVLFPHSHPIADRIPVPMGISLDPWDSSLSHSHAHLWTKVQYCAKTLSQK